MSYKTCIIKNISGNILDLNGHEFVANETYQILDERRLSWANSDNVLVAITGAKIQIGDGESFFESYNDQINWLKDY